MSNGRITGGRFIRLFKHVSLRAFTSLSSLTLWLILLLSHVNAFAQTPDQVGEWGPVLDWGYQAKHMVLLPTGNVLVFRTGDSARVWNPETGVFTQTPSFFGDLHCGAQVTLADGRVIVVGGQDGSIHHGTKVTSLFDPFTNTWTQGAVMAYERWYGTATTLPDGRVLAVSGDNASGGRVTIPEVYDPVADTWTKLSGANRSQGLYPFMFLLPNGEVYEAGTGTATWRLALGGTGSWTRGPTNGFGSGGYAESAATYAPGKIIRSGGGDPATARAAIIDMTAASPQWKQISPMAFARRRHNLVILADGSVMAEGGTRQADSEASAVLEGEIWHPDTEQWTTVAAMSEGRAYHSTALLLPDGRVVSAGGEMSGRLHAQIYSPPYLFKGPRPVITSSPGSASYGSSFTVGMSDAAGIASVALIRPAGVTHAFDHNQRYVPLLFTQSGTQLTVAAPANGNIAPPGYYMLIAKGMTSIPSAAKWVRLDATTNLQPGTIIGRVTDSGTGFGISGATASYSGGSATANQTGGYTLTDVPPGEHLVVASATGYATVSQTATVAAGGTSTLDFALPGPGVKHEETRTGGSTNSTKVRTAASLTLVSNDLYVAAISTKPNVGVTGVSGLGLSWTRVKAQCSGRNQTGVEVWTAQGAPGGNRTVTAVLNKAPSNAVIAVSRYSGVTTVSPVGTIVHGNTKGAQGACTGGGNNSSYSFSMMTTVNRPVIYGAAAMTENEVWRSKLERHEARLIAAALNGKPGPVPFQGPADASWAADAVPGYEPDEASARR